MEKLVGNKLGSMEPNQQTNNVGEQVDQKEKLKPWEEKPEFKAENIDSSVKRRAIINYLKSETKSQLDQQVEMGEITKEEAGRRLFQIQDQLKKTNQNLEMSKKGVGSSTSLYEEAFLNLTNELAWNTQKDDRAIDRIRDTLKNKETIDGQKPWDIDGLIRQGRLNPVEAEQKKKTVEQAVFGSFVREKIRKNEGKNEAVSRNYDEMRSTLSQKEDEYQKERKALDAINPSDIKAIRVQRETISKLRGEITDLENQIDDLWEDKFLIEAVKDNRHKFPSEKIKEKFDKYREDAISRYEERIARREELRKRLEGLSQNNTRNVVRDKTEDTGHNGVNLGKDNTQSTNVEDIPEQELDTQDINTDKSKTEESIGPVYLEGNMNFADYKVFLGGGVAGRRMNRLRSAEENKRIDDIYNKYNNLKPNSAHEKQKFEDGQRISEIFLEEKDQKLQGIVKQNVDNLRYGLKEANLTIKENRREDFLNYGALSGYESVLEQGHLNEDLKELQKYGDLITSAYVFWGLQDAKKALLFRHNPEEAMRRRLRNQGRDFDQELKAGKIEINVDEDRLLTFDEYNTAKLVVLGVEKKILERIMEVNGLERYSDAVNIMDQLRNSDFYKKAVAEQIERTKLDEDKNETDLGKDKIEKAGGANSENKNKIVTRESERRRLAKGYILKWFTAVDDLKDIAKKEGESFDAYMKGKDVYGSLTKNTESETPEETERRHNKDRSDYDALLKKLGFDKYFEKAGERLAGKYQKFNTTYIYEKMENTSVRMRADLDKNRDKMSAVELQKRKEELEFIEALKESFLDVATLVKKESEEKSGKKSSGRLTREILLTRAKNPLYRLQKAIMDAPR